jgi:energy-coupling factor transporter ATP-binding protein EcfA2
VLLALKQEAQPNEAQFARTFTSYSESMFSKILAAVDPERNKSYFDEIKTDEARESLLDDLAELLKKLPSLRLENERVGNLKLRAITPFAAVAKAVRGCKNKTSPERLVKAIGPTGAGKTTLRNYLEVALRGELKMAAVESRDAWRPADPRYRQRCKVVVLRDLFEAFGLKVNPEWSHSDVPTMEDDLIDFLTKNRRVLFIDEAEFFSAYALNLLKLLLNKTRVIIVLACTPRAHAKWNTWYPDEADQISRRTDAIVALDKLAPADVGLFFDKTAFANREASLEYLAVEASRFGHLSLIARTARLLEKYPEAEKAQVAQCLEAALRQMAKQRTTGEAR